MATSLAETIRESARWSEVEVSDALARVRQQARAGRGTPTWDALLREVVESYRLGPKQGWAPVLLEALAPAMTCELLRLRPLAAGVSSEDVSQQLVLEVLAAAALIPLPPGCAYVDRRILMRAHNRVSRWLRREARLEASCVYVNPLP